MDTIPPLLLLLFPFLSFTALLFILKFLLSHITSKTMSAFSASQTTNNHVYFATTTHTRFNPVRHAFRYPVLYVGVDLNDIERGTVLAPGWSWLWGYNRAALFMLRDDDYLGKVEGVGKSIRKKLLWHLEQRGVQTSDLTRLTLVTTPRFLSYSFNPVSFYFAYAGSNSELVLRAIVLEVNNTFGEKHLYILDSQKKALSSSPKNLRGGQYDRSFLIDRTFHVSPFNDRSGQYEALCRDPFRGGFANPPHLDMRIIVHNNPDPALSIADSSRTGKKFMAEVHASGVALTPSSLGRAAFAYSTGVFLTVPRIIWEAARLTYVKKMPIYPRPEPVKVGNDGAKETVGWKSPDGTEIYFAALVYDWWVNLLKGTNIRIIVYPPSPYDPPTVITALENTDAIATKDIHLHLANYTLFTSIALHEDLINALLITYTSKAWWCDDVSELRNLLDLLVLSSTSVQAASIREGTHMTIAAFIRQRHWHGAVWTSDLAQVASLLPADLPPPLHHPTPNGPLSINHPLDIHAHRSYTYNRQLFTAAFSYRLEKTIFGALATFVSRRHPFETAARAWEGVAHVLENRKGIQDDDERDWTEKELWERSAMFLEAIGTQN